MYQAYLLLNSIQIGQTLMQCIGLATKYRIGDLAHKICILNLVFYAYLFLVLFLPRALTKVGQRRQAHVSPFLGVNGA